MAKERGGRMIHAKKIRKEYFEKVIAGEKPYEVRFNDCDYQENDLLALNEIDDKEKYTGRSALFEIREVFSNKEFTKENFVILTIAPCTLIYEELGANAIVYERGDKSVR